MLNKDIHVVTSADLIPSLHRQYRVVSLWELEAQFTVKLAGLTKAGADRMHTNLSSEENPSLMLQGIKVIQSTLSSTESIKKMLRVAVQATKDELDNWATPAANNKNKKVNLLEWLQHELTIVITESLYGDKNPYRDPEVEAGFWAFSEGTLKLLLPDFLTKIFASEGVRGRAAVVKAFQNYFTSGSQAGGSDLMKNRFELLVDHADTQNSDLARHENLIDIAALSNTVPSAFWVIYHLFSDASLLEQVRTQVAELTTSEVSAQGETICKINLQKLIQLPILSSLILETLRFRSTGTGPRLVMEDTLIGKDQQYLLKKGSLLIIANKTLHFDKRAWGDRADSFRFDRFYGKVPANAFRVFGGGANRCPGQGIVTNVIAAFAGMFMMRFDIIPNGNDWTDPGQDLVNMSTQTGPPKEKFMVNIVPRESAKNVVWSFEM
ncbi:putative cytochrome p450 protein [Botrytis cinerea BcDW1]|uniref:Putative cytochrome p450 protein n=1 Tax=Botryotinia fuckeliana (strain BcDW1) TaxID=1290391 RepID=M7TIT3_BOTF1|nr:putative cytochrome p450 protein [Botrytis cinerea BcDW1]